MPKYFLSPLTYILPLFLAKFSVSATFFGDRTGQDRQDRQTNRHMDRQTFLVKHYFKYDPKIAPLPLSIVIYIPIDTSFLDVQVECVKNLDETQAPKFDEPNGWKNQKCRSKTYPDFRADPCICPGDNGVNQGIAIAGSIFFFFALSSKMFYVFCSLPLSFLSRKTGLGLWAFNITKKKEREGFSKCLHKYSRSLI